MHILYTVNLKSSCTRKQNTFFNDSQTLFPLIEPHYGSSGLGLAWPSSYLWRLWPHLIMMFFLPGF